MTVVVFGLIQHRLKRGTGYRFHNFLPPPVSNSVSQLIIRVLVYRDFYHCIRRQSCKLFDVRGTDLINEYELIRRLLAYIGCFLNVNGHWM
jgi:hypothetical protein